MQTKRTRNRAAPALDSLLPNPRQPPQPPALRSAAARGLAPVEPPMRSASPTLDAHGYDPDAYDWVPVPRKRRVDGCTPERQRAFIGLLADTGSVRLAATQSGMSTQSAYRLRRAPEGAAFAAAWDAAIQQAAHALVDAAFERAVHGSEEPVWNRDGRVIGRRFRQSDAMMMFLLRKHFPDRYGDNHRDRAGPAIAATAAPPPPVAETLQRLGPVPPADPAATLDPDMLGLALARADNGRLPPDWSPDDDPDEADGLGDDFEAALEAAKAAADAPLPADDEEDWDDMDDEDWDDEDLDDEDGEDEDGEDADLGGSDDAAADADDTGDRM